MSICLVWPSVWKLKILRKSGEMKENKIKKKKLDNIFQYLFVTMGKY